MTETLRITTDQLAYSQIYLKSLRDAFFVNYPILWTSFCQNTIVVFAKVATQYCLLAMLEKWKSVVDKGKSFGALLTDLSNAFDCLSHELLLAKLHAYGFSISTLRLIHSYLTNRRQRTKINMPYSSWVEIVFGVAQGSILGPLLFNIFLCDIFFIMKDFHNERLFKLCR